MRMQHIFVASLAVVTIALTGGLLLALREPSLPQTTEPSTEPSSRSPSPGSEVTDPGRETATPTEPVAADRTAFERAPLPGVHAADTLPPVPAPARHVAPGPDVGGVDGRRPPRPVPGLRGETD